MTKLRHYDNLGTARFVTFSTYRRTPILCDVEDIQTLLRYIGAARVKYGLLLRGYVIMPGHVHLVLELPDHVTLGPMIGEIKSRSARDILRGQSGESVERVRVFWQRRCYDHNCRTPESVVEKIRYCHNNPVNRGLVGSPGKWRWSSYNSYHGVDRVPIRVDEVEL